MTVVFRFFIDTLAKFHIKRHTRFAYVARIGPCQRHAARRRGYGRTSSDMDWFLSGAPAPLPGAARKGLRALPCKVLGRSLLKRSGDRFSVLSPAAGSVCNLPSQRALHSAGRTHLPPQNAEIIPRPLPPRQLHDRPNWRTVSGTQCQNANSAPRLQTR